MVFMIYCSLIFPNLNEASDIGCAEINLMILSFIKIRPGVYAVQGNIGMDIHTCIRR